jgi:hypothetical protein
MSKKYRKKYSLLFVAGLAMAAPAAYSAVMPTWVGTANYSGLPDAPSNLGPTGSFDTYDFGNGVGAIVNADSSQSVGSTFAGYYQTYVTQQQLAGVGVTVPGLNSTGSGSGFQITMQAEFNGDYTFNNSGIKAFEITGGTAALYFGPIPDYSFVNDSGFGPGNNVTKLLSGAIDTGSGTLLSSGFGFSQLDFSGAFGNAAAGVYNPDTIGGGLSIFTINLANNVPVLNGVTSVMGQTSNLYSADGSLQLSAVPLPAAVWFFLSVMMGLLAANKRKQIID